MIPELNDLFYIKSIIGWNYSIKNKFLFITSFSGLNALSSFHQHAALCLKSKVITRNYLIIIIKYDSRN